MVAKAPRLWALNHTIREVRSQAIEDRQSALTICASMIVARGLLVEVGGANAGRLFALLRSRAQRIHASSLRDLFCRLRTI